MIVRVHVSSRDWLPLTQAPHGVALDSTHEDITQSTGGGFSTGTNCPLANGQSGAMPSVLLTQQTNSQNQVGGPFLNSLPSLPQGWTGSGTSYKYASTAAGSYYVCGSGDSTAADSNGGATCP